MHDNVLKRINSFTGASKFQQIALSCIAHQCDSEEIQESKKIFFSIDKNSDGYITFKELKDATKGKLSEE